VLEKVSLDADSVGLDARYKQVETQWKCTLDRTSSMKQRLDLDVTRWRNLAGHLEELAAWAVSREPDLADIGTSDESQDLQLSLQRRADDCGLLLVELEAKTPVINQALESSNEAIESFNYLKMDESELEPSTRAALDNLRDRQKEVISVFDQLQANVNAWRDSIYQKLDAYSKLDEKIQIISEICARAEEDKGKLQGPDVQVGEVYIKEMDNQMSELGDHPEVIEKTAAVKRRWGAIQKVKETGKTSRPVSIVCDEPISTVINAEPEVLPPPTTEDMVMTDAPHTPIKGRV